MSKTHFGPISPQVYTLGPSPHVRLNLKKKVVWKVLVMKFWIKWGVLCENLTSGCEVILKTHFFPFAPNLCARPQPPWCLNLHTKKLSSVGCNILNEIRGCLWKSDKWLPSYVKKPILGPFAPNLCTRTQYPYETKFFREIVWKVLFMKFWIKWGVVFLKSDKTF